MFPIAHAWLVEQLAPETQPAHYLGCVWPDMLFGGPLTHTQSHRSGLALVRALPAAGAPEHSALRAFVAGVLTHGIEPHGFDWYSDERYGDAPEEARGYAFQRGKPLADETAAACGLDAKDGWWKAHNIVEMAFERSLYRDRPERGVGIFAACDDDQLVAVVSDWLAGVFEVASADLAAAIRRFPEVVELRPDSVEALATVYALQTRIKHPGAEPDAERIAALIARVEREIAGDRDAFLARCRAEVGTMLADALPS
jgi:hypothetical protein